MRMMRRKPHSLQYKKGKVTTILTNTELKKNGTYMLNDSLIKSIFIDDSLEKMTVEFKDGVTYSKNREEIDIFLNQILFKHHIIILYQKS